MISSKKGKLYLKFVLVVAILAAAFYAYSAFAAVPTATPAIVNTNSTTVNSIQIANASIARASDQLFGYANFSSENGTTEENSTFKWYKRTLYQPQTGGVDKAQVVSNTTVHSRNDATCGAPLIADGNGNSDDKGIA